MVSSQVNIRRALRQCSFSQTWCPGLAFDGQRVFRPSLLVLASESARQVLSSEMSADYQDLYRVGIWLDLCFQELGDPEELLVPNLEILEFLRYRYPSTRLRVQPESLVLQNSIHHLTSDFREPVPSCIAHLFGENKAREIFRAAVELTQAAPWKMLEDNVVLRFGVGRTDYCAMVAGFSRENEQSICLFSDSDSLLREQMLACYAPGGSTFVHHRDLNLADRWGLVMPRQKYPMFLRADGKIGRGRIEDLLWLMQRLPEFAKDRMPIEEGTRRLAVTGELRDHWFGRTGRDA